MKRSINCKWVSICSGFSPCNEICWKTTPGIGFSYGLQSAGALDQSPGTKNQLMGVYDRDLTSKLAEVLLRLEAKHAMVVHGLDGLG